MQPDATGKRTARTRCILEKIKPAEATPDTKPPNIDDTFVDGKASNLTINGHYVGYWICSWKGNYNNWVDRNDHGKGQVPLSTPDLVKFFGKVPTFLKGSGFLPSNTEDQILQNLDFLNIRITHGMLRVERYMTANDTAFAYAGDLTRHQLKNFTAKWINNSNSILSCYVGYNGGEVDSDPADEPPDHSCF